MSTNSARKKRVEEKQAFQAVLVCDSFNTRFLPLTHNKPRVLLPLINVPLLEYSLNSLKSAGIEDVFLFACAHWQQIKDFVEQWTKRRENSAMNVKIFSSDAYHSLGDAMRDLDAHGLVRHDFILMFGDCISNLDLKSYLEEHKNNSKNDKGNVMTLLFKRSSRERKIQMGDKEVMLIVDGVSSKLLHYEKVPKLQRKLDISTALLKENRNVKMYFNLQDTHVAVCSVNVLSLFSDNFDYETKDDFIKGILEQEEILGNSIYLRICDSNSYSARVINPSSYDVISREILERWAFPIVPDLQERICFQRHNIYKFDNVMLTLDSKVVKNVAIGKETVVGKNASIVNSVIGSNCKIGANVSIEGSYLWDNVVVGDNCSLKTCIIGNNVEIKTGTFISNGSLIADDVVVGPNVKLENKYLQSEPNDDDEVIDVSVVGVEGKGYLLKEDEDDDDATVTDVWGHEKVEHGDEDDISFKSSVSDLDNIEEEVDEVRMFYTEILDSFQRGFEEKVATENLVLEVNSSKFAYNIPIEELGYLVVKAILDLSKNQFELLENKKTYGQHLDCVIDRFRALITHYMKQKDQHYNFLAAVEEFCLSNTSLVTSNNAVKLIKDFFDNDVLSEDIILEWAQSPKPLPALLTDVEFTIDDQQSFRKKQPFPKFFEWLQEAEEESDEE